MGYIMDIFAAWWLVEPTPLKKIRLRQLEMIILFPKNHGNSYMRNVPVTTNSLFVFSDISPTIDSLQLEDFWWMFKPRG